MQPLDYGIEQRRAEILEHVPEQDSVEVAVLVVERLLEEVLDLSGIGLVSVVWSERIVQDFQEAFAV